MELGYQPGPSGRASPQECGRQGFAVPDDLPGSSRHRHPSVQANQVNRETRALGVFEWGTNRELHFGDQRRIQATDL